MLAEVSSNHQVPTPARNDVSLWASNVFGNISLEFIITTLSHIGLSPMQPTPPSTPFLSTSFPFLNDSGSDSMVDENIVHVLHEA